VYVGSAAQRADGPIGGIFLVLLTLSNSRLMRANKTGENPKKIRALRACTQKTSTSCRHDIHFFAKPMLLDVSSSLLILHASSFNTSLHLSPPTMHAP